MGKQRVLTTKDRILHLLDAGEHETTEFKSSLRWNRRRKQIDKNLENAVVKTVAGFLNGPQGGILLIGVNDAGTAVGIGDDINTLGSKKRNRDGFELHFRNLVAAKIGEAATSYVAVTFHEIDGKDIFHVTVKPSSKPVFIKNLQGQETLYLRIGNSTRPLPLSEAVKYVQDRWGKPEPYEDGILNFWFGGSKFGG